MAEVKGKSRIIAGKISELSEPWHGQGVLRSGHESGRRRCAGQNRCGEAIGYLLKTNRAVHPLKLDVTNREDWQKRPTRPSAVRQGACAGQQCRRRRRRHDADRPGKTGTSAWASTPAAVVDGVKTMLPRMLGHGEDGQYRLHGFDGAELYSRRTRAESPRASKFAVVGLCEALRNDLLEARSASRSIARGPVAHQSRPLEAQETRPAHLASRPVHVRGDPLNHHHLRTSRPSPARRR